MLVFRKYLPDPLLNVGLIDRLLLFCLGVVFSSGAGMCSLHLLHILDSKLIQRAHRNFCLLTGSY